MQPNTKRCRMKRTATAMRLPLLALALAIGLAGCVALEQLAPSVTADLAGIGQSQGFEMGTLQRGRHIYLTQCASCHSVEPIDGWSLSEWEHLLPEMNEESELNPKDASDLRAYIMTARRLVDQPGYTAAAQ